MAQISRSTTGASGSAVKLDTGHHDRRLARRLQDPEFHAVYDRVYDRNREAFAAVIGTGAGEDPRAAEARLLELTGLTSAELARDCEEADAALAAGLTRPMSEVISENLTKILAEVEAERLAQGDETVDLTDEQLEDLMNFFTPQTLADIDATELQIAGHTMTPLEDAIALLDDASSYMDPEGDIGSSTFISEEEFIARHGGVDY